MGKNRWSERQKQLQESLRELRDNAGLTQVELAEILGRPQSFISKIESGERRVDIVELEEICEVCKSDLLEFTREFMKK
tara:strand:+ start:42 stop:278 length:237 start_codon:yes stop_codon:yes gene_type:complete